MPTAEMLEATSQQYDTQRQHKVKVQSGDCDTRLGSPSESLPPSFTPRKLAGPYSGFFSPRAGWGRRQHCMSGTRGGRARYPLGLREKHTAHHEVLPQALCPLEMTWPRCCQGPGADLRGPFLKAGSPGLKSIALGAQCPRDSHLTYSQSLLPAPRVSSPGPSSQTAAAPSHCAEP